MVDGSDLDRFVGQLSLILCDDLECIQNAGEGWLGPNPLDRVLVEKIVDPGNLGNLW